MMVNKEQRKEYNRQAYLKKKAKLKNEMEEKQNEENIQELLYTNKIT